MIFLNMEDGLGNQLFEYSFARRLQSIYNDKLVISLSQFDLKKQVYPEMKHVMDNFKLADNIEFVDGVKGKLIRVYILGKHWLFRLLLFPLRKNKRRATEISNKMGLYYDFTGAWIYSEPQITRRRNKYITGRFQSEKYFSGISEDIKAELEIVNGVGEECKKYGKEIELFGDSAVALHIRRGDYLKEENRGMMVCTSYYYENAMRQVTRLVKNPVFVIFTDSQKDLQWIRNNFMFLEGYKVIYPQKEYSAIEDFWLMTKCYHYVLSNSSFSWWAQFLSNNNNNKIVIAPDRWNLDGIKDKDVYQKNWIICKTEEK